MDGDHFVATNPESVVASTCPDPAEVVSALHVADGSSLTPDRVVDIRCSGGWATAGITAGSYDAVDGLFVVLNQRGGGWVAANWGTAEVCVGAGVPNELFSSLGCYS